MKKTLNIVGCGKVGSAFARLFAQGHVFEVQDAMDLSAAAARRLVAFADAGRPVRRYEELRPARVWLIATPDAQIAAACEALCDAGCVARGVVVCHTSGAMPSTDLRAASELGAHVASLHPVRTFADPAAAAGAFAGTHVAVEGDRKALRVLRPALRRIGARLLEISPEQKLAYHAASVFVCNYLTALLEVGLRCYDAAGIRLESAYRLMEPLARETLDNVFRLGTVRALTGPVARGDHAVVAREIAALVQLDPRIADLYRGLGAVALELARSQGSGDAGGLERLGRLLEGRRAR